MIIWLDIIVDFSIKKIRFTSYDIVIFFVFDITILLIKISWS